MLIGFGSLVVIVGWMAFGIYEVTKSSKEV